MIEKPEKVEVKNESLELKENKKASEKSSSIEWETSQNKQFTNKRIPDEVYIDQCIQDIKQYYSEKKEDNKKEEFSSSNTSKSSSF